MLSGILLEVPVFAAGTLPSNCCGDSGLFLEGEGRCGQSRLGGKGWSGPFWAAGISAPLSLGGGTSGQRDVMLAISGVITDPRWEDAASVLGMSFPRGSFLYILCTPNSPPPVTRAVVPPAPHLPSPFLRLDVRTPSSDKGSPFFRACL